MNLQINTTHRISNVAIFIAVIVALIMGGSLYKTVLLKIAPPEELIKASAPLNSTSIRIAKRGNLLDRRGRILAASRVGYTLFADPSLVEDPTELALELSDKLGLSAAYLEEKIRSRPEGRYVVLEPLLSEDQVTAARTLEHRCIGLEQRLVRVYPHGDVGEMLIGLVGTEHSGLAGFENSFNATLTGESGKITRQRDSKRRTLWVSPNQYIPTNDGEDVRLSIDIVIQDIATTRLNHI